ncbi:MAG: hypothetical protein FD176_474 [Rhodospirillaceae bacterium]|nr:MAG: hypothetical protein FD176_474 [Rhodospirillaceae bacterium]TNC95247.1 MAG: hypothetical protein FD119_2371 [Stygiobacter sp.]
MARSIKLNLANLIVTNAEQHPDAIALSLGASPHASYKQLLARMRSIRDHLICDRGLRPGDRVALAMRNSAYVFMDRLPKNPTGKIIKTELRRLAAEA